MNELLTRRTRHTDGEAPFASETEAQLLTRLQSSSDGLTQPDAAARLARVGPNRVGASSHASNLTLLRRQFSSPIMVLLIVATLLSFFLGDTVDAAIILVIVVASGTLGFFQERSAVDAIRALQSAVRVHADVMRDGREQSIPLEDVVPGDIVHLDAGDVVPGDCLVLSSDALTVNESALTGESYPVHKRARGDAPSADSDHANDAAGDAAGGTGLGSAADRRSHCLFLGTHVVSGSGTALVAATGNTTMLGTIGATLTEAEPPTSFERGLTSFGLLIMRVGVSLITGVFLIDVLLHRPWLESLLFSLALAVGITPQLLPAIVTVTLSRGARAMARAQVVVKRLSSIEDLGVMDTLCVDKTGTLTAGAVTLDAAMDIDGTVSPEVGRLAWLNAHHQSSFTNPIDDAIVKSVEVPADAGRLVDELPYDFERQRLSVVVASGSTTQLIAKGSVRSIASVCTHARRPDGSTVALDDVHGQIDDLVRRRSDEGIRILAIASRDLPSDTSAVTIEDERDLVLEGLLAFADPVKTDVNETVAALSRAGVSVRMLTGDNRHVAAHVASVVGLDTTHMMVGADIDALDDHALDQAIGAVSVVAEVEPAHKQRIIRSLIRTGHNTGFLGDGINDVMALRAADVGISVDTGTDVAKESAAIVLLTKELSVVLDGVRLGRQTFANTLKYVFVTTSANFGNMISMAGSAVVLPFVPLLPRQILLLNFLSDIPGTTIATDRVDPELVERPTAWNIAFIRQFMVVFGLLSSAFDYLTFAVLRWGFDADAEMFRTGWFLVSVGTELTVMLILRTRRPFTQSRPGRALALSTAAIGALSLATPYTGLGRALGFERPSWALLGALLAILLGYLATTEAAKHVFYRRTRTAAA